MLIIILRQSNYYETDNLQKMAYICHFLADFDKMRIYRVVPKVRQFCLFVHNIFIGLKTRLICVIVAVTENK